MRTETTRIGRPSARMVAQYMLTATGTTVALFLCIGGFSWLFEGENYKNPSNWFLGVIALLLLSKAIRSVLEETD